MISSKTIKHMVKNAPLHPEGKKRVPSPFAIAYVLFLCNCVIVSEIMFKYISTTPRNALKPCMHIFFVTTIPYNDVDSYSHTAINNE